MRALQSILCIILLPALLIIPASSQTKGMRIFNPRTNTVESVKGYENSYAVCIGIDEYENWPRLGCAVADAEAIQKKLMEHGFAEARLITNQKATRDGILSSIAWLGKVVGKEDRVVIYFSGHGETIEGRTKTVGYIIPVDCPRKDYYVNAISMEKIRGATEEIKAKHILYVMDCCYSGIALMTRGADEAFMIEMTKDPCVYMITAGKGGEEALETGGHGIFTRYILRGLDGEADYDKNGVVSGTELGLYSNKWVSYEARQRNKTQTPQFGRLDGEGEIVFVPQVEERVEEEPEELMDIQEIETEATLEVDSDPAGASVHIDGQQVGTTPCTVKIDAGVEGRREVTVAVSKEGYGTKRAKANLVAGRRAKWTDMRLEKISVSPTITQQSKIGKDGAPMVLIPAGEFQMGSDDGDSDKKPVHTVYLDAFYMDVYEVTNAQYKKFMDATGREAPGYWDNPRFKDPKQPVMGVSWYDAKAYADWAGKRLPTEAEWEKAARGGLVGKKYPWGNGIGPNAANYRGVSRDSRDVWEYTAPVGKFPPNNYGLYDMAGNVWEWCADWYDKNYYSNSRRRNPTGPDSGSWRVLRGGSRITSDSSLRVAYRNNGVPTYADSSVGFRCVE